MASESPVRVEKKGGVFTVIISRPQNKNAINQQAADLLTKAFKEFEADEESKVLVLWGEGGTFCAGADLKEVSEMPNSNRRPTQSVGAGDAPLGPSRMLLTKPSIAAVSGYAVAGGFELALLCDLRVVEEDAVFGVFCRRWGVPLIDGGTVRLPRLIGQSRAMDLILTGRPVSAKEAYEIGLANRVVPKGQARAEAEKLAAQLCLYPQVCMRGDRMSAIQQWDLGLMEALQNEFIHGSKSLTLETIQGAKKFAGGEGRHGSFDAFKPKL